MRIRAIAAAVSVAVLMLVGIAVAEEKKEPVAGGPVAGKTEMAAAVSVTELEMVAKGWSVKKHVMDKEVYNAKGDKIGKIEDLIVTPSDAVSYAIIGVGGFLGMDKHDVAIPMKLLQHKDGKFELPNATKEELKKMPKFEYEKK